jgi:hypothetical protein
MKYKKLSYLKINLSSYQFLVENISIFYIIYRASSSKTLLTNQYFYDLLATQAFKGIINIIEFSSSRFSCLTIGIYFPY